MSIEKTEEISQAVKEKVAVLKNAIKVALLHSPSHTFGEYEVLSEDEDGSCSILAELSFNPFYSDDGRVSPEICSIDFEYRASDDEWLIIVGDDADELTINESSLISVIYFYSLKSDKAKAALSQQDAVPVFACASDLKQMQEGSLSWSTVFANPHPHRSNVALFASPPSTAQEGPLPEIYEQYKNWPDDIKKKLSVHDLRRMTGWRLHCCEPSQPSVAESLRTIASWLDCESPDFTGGPTYHEADMIGMEISGPTGCGDGNACLRAARKAFLVAADLWARSEAFGRPALPAKAPEIEEGSETKGMNLGERIAHVGGRENKAGYIEFGSVMAVQALIHHVIRDIDRPSQPTAQGVEEWIEKAKVWSGFEHDYFVIEVDKVRAFLSSPPLEDGMREDQWFVTPRVRDGLEVMPTEPSEKMLMAGAKIYREAESNPSKPVIEVISRLYEAMLEAASKGER